MALIQNILRKAELLALANHAGQGDPRAAAKLLRAFINGEAASDFLDPGGAGFTGGTGTIRRGYVVRNGKFIKSELLVDLTGLASSTTDLDIIGVGTSPAYAFQYLGERHGQIPFAGTLKCLEVPVGGVTDIDLYYATEGTGVFDDGVAALTETALITAGGAWTLALEKAIADPVSMLNKYVYFCGGAAGTAAAYTAGKFLLTLYGYDT